MNFSDPNLMLWLVPIGPLLAFLVISIITNRARMLPATDHHYGGHHPDYDGMDVPVVRDSSRVASIIVAMSGVVAAWIMSWRVFFYTVGLEDFGEVVVGSRLNWMSIGTGNFQIGVFADPLNAVMLFMAPLADDDDLHL
jgi:NADH:ubiquinone oxidoreductase subunit 5 (subunit L)/multisubunit Na+/H+ antiporter MnhA subunit